MTTELIIKLKNSQEKAIKTFHTTLTPLGTYTDTVEDIAVYYKHPMMWSSLGDEKKANLVLDHIKEIYLQKNGDFTLNSCLPKSGNPAYQEFYAYTNGWISRAAKKCQREDICTSALEYLTSFHDSQIGGFYTHSLEQRDGITDVITTAHLGLVHLEAGLLEQAIAAGDYLCDALLLQPDLKQGFYLRRSAVGDCITEFPLEFSSMFFVSVSEPNQLYFMVAYPIAYLTELYRRTNRVEYLESAKLYADFALNCHESVFACEFSHKLAWALSELYRETLEESYLVAVEKIIDYFISIQEEDGLWFSSDVLKCFDQSAEIICWFSSIQRALSYKKKLKITDAKNSIVFGDIVTVAQQHSNKSKNPSIS